MTIPAPVPLEVRRDTMSREIRLELADWRTRTGGVYALAPADQEKLLIAGSLPHWGLFLPDFVIVLATGRAISDTEAEWTDLRVHVGGIPWTTISNEWARNLANGVSYDWHSLDVLLHGDRIGRPAAPRWLLDLIAAHTPWASLLQTGQPR